MADEDDGDRPSRVAEPTQSTYAWSPVGEPCEACGAAVGRRWRDGDALVCEDCKEW